MLNYASSVFEYLDIEYYFINVYLYIQIPLIFMFMISARELHVSAIGVGIGCVVPERVEEMTIGHKSKMQMGVEMSIEVPRGQCVSPCCWYGLIDPISPTTPPTVQPAVTRETIKSGIDDFVKISMKEKSTFLYPVVYDFISTFNVWV